MGKITKIIFALFIIVVALLISTSVNDDDEIIGYTDHGIPVTKKDLKE